jgi:hypothetical protein
MMSLYIFNIYRYRNVSDAQITKTIGYGYCYAVKGQLDEKGATSFFKDTC